MDPLGIASSVLRVARLSSELARALQYLHCRMDTEHEDYLRSLGKFEDLVDKFHTNLKVNGVIPGDLGETIGLASKRYLEGISSPMLLDSVLYNPSKTSSRTATWGTRQPNYTSKTTLVRRREIIKLSQETVASVDLLDPFERPDHSPLDPPFYDFGNYSTPIFDDVEAIKPGGTSQVFRVVIHPSNIPDYKEERRKEITFAVKKIYSGTHGDYARERDAYQRLNLVQNPHPHIVPLLASYRMENKYHLVFPLADCDLAMYWRKQPTPPIKRGASEWFGGQMRGLVDALFTLHGQNNHERNRHLVHGDLKPENILIFGSNDSDRWPRFALTDFGSSYFCTTEERDIPKGLKYTPAYRAPEIDTTTLGITQAYDVWSLGCVFAEAIAWFCDGKDGISKLIQSRLDEEDNSPSRDAFFRLHYDKRGDLMAKLKPEVHRLLISLHESSRSSLFIDDMIYIVLEGMLKVNVNERMSSQEILDALTQMCLRLENDPAYSECRRNSDGEMIHTQHASRRRLDNTVDANYYTNVTTQSDTGTQIRSKPRFSCPYHKAGILVSVHHRACEGPGWIDVNKVKYGTSLPLPSSKEVPRQAYLSAVRHKLRNRRAALDSSASRNTMPEKETRGCLRYAFQRASCSTPFPQEEVIERKRGGPMVRYLRDRISELQPETGGYLAISNGISQYRDYLRSRGAEEYASKLAKMGINVTPDGAAKLLELQVKDLETFDETMREPVRAYGIPTGAGHEKTGNSAPSDLGGSSDLLSQFQLLARFGDDMEH
ncbi:hypothetical protein FGADI_2787 [Fusarium gaditjirri]|uniref:Protein kinase domain-containing protein n=1 Tax=Fusarium gaditjirri TaxID=282569 RepID=A0A8H4TH86_9HYPO|nr:hypothetical protein FGADI_2787 [Fusarium gaditjirri]